MVIPPPSTFLPGRPNASLPGVVVTNSFTSSSLPMHSSNSQEVQNVALNQQQHLSQAHKPIGAPNDRPQIISKSDSPWTEHAATSGLKYYYNSVTKESTYTYIRPQG